MLLDMLHDIRRGIQRKYCSYTLYYILLMYLCCTTDMLQGPSPALNSSPSSPAAGAPSAVSGAFAFAPDCGDILDHHQVTGPINTNLMGPGPLPSELLNKPLFS